MLGAQWTCSWATVHGKYIGQVMGRYETVTVSNLLAHEWAVHSLIWGCCRSLNALFVILFHGQKETMMGNYTIRMFPPAIDIIPTSLAVVYSNGKYTNYKN